MRHPESTLWIILIGVGCASGTAPAAPPTTPAAPQPTTSAPQPAARPGASAAELRAAEGTITASDAFERISFLASDELLGRDTPSPGLETAAEYIANEFRSFGLEPGGDDGGYIQRWPYTNVRFERERVSLSVRGPQGTASADFGRDFFLFPGPTDSVTAPIVFAGQATPGRQAVGAAGSGRVVAFYIPGAVLNGAWQQNLLAAMTAAMSAQPSAILLVLDPEFDEVRNIAGELAGQPVPLPIVGLTYEAALRLFAGTGADVEALRTSSAVTPIDGTTMTAVSSRIGGPAEPPNVVGILRGSDPVLRDTYVVFSAHIDHVGVSFPDATGDSIYNGADDDASGTTALIEVAQAFASLPTPPARSLIFLGVSGEEKGLFGSQHFTRNPTVPRESMIADINIDMIGRNAPDTVVAIGQDYSSLGRVVQEVARQHPELGLTVAPDLWPEEQLFVRSDHFNFALIGVPPLFFTTGLHDDYHQPSDEVDTIDTDKVARVARLVFYLGNAIANRVDPPTWTEAGRRVVQSAGGG